MKDGIEHTVELLKQYWKTEPLLIIQPFIIAFLLTVACHLASKQLF